MLHYNANFLITVKLLEYFFSVIFSVTAYFLLSKCIEQFMTPLKFITLQPNLPMANEKVPLLLNTVLYAEYFYLSILKFLVNLTAPIKGFSKLGQSPQLWFEKNIS